MTQQRLNRNIFVEGAEIWASLPLSLQLDAIINCAHFNGWNPDALLGEIRHWMRLISFDQQVNYWGDSLFDTQNPASINDGSQMMAVMEYIIRNESRYRMPLR